MAVAGTNLTSGISATVASVTTLANNLGILVVSTRTNITADPNIPTITDAGRTWTQIATIVWDTTSASRKRITAFRNLSGSNVTGGATVDFAGQVQTDVNVSVDTFSGVDTTGTNGSGAIVQAVTNKDESATTNVFAVTLAAFSNVNNATWGGIVSDNSGGSIAVGSGFSSLSNTNSTNLNMVSEWKATNATTVNATASGNAMFGGIAIEIAAAGGGGTVAHNLMLLGIGV